LYYNSRPFGRRRAQQQPFPLCHWKKTQLIPTLMLSLMPSKIRRTSWLILASLYAIHSSYVVLLFLSYSSAPCPRHSALWPGRGESQSHGDLSSPPTFCDIWAHVQAFLDSSDRLSIASLGWSFSVEVLCSHMWLTRPWLPYHRRKWGFGRISSDRSVTTDSPTLFHVFHHLWSFFTPKDRRSNQRASPQFLCYSFQHFHAVTTSVAVLRASRDAPCRQA
jgi:hypothetical protein